MISITTVENAINRWRDRFPADPATCAVCQQVNVLGDLYAHIIYFRQVEVKDDVLTPEQHEAIAMSL